jgi:peptidyl-prolyl cis-trans isomerase D
MSFPEYGRAHERQGVLMLAFFRRRMKAILWVLVIVVIVTFIPWGVGVRLRSRGEKHVTTAGELFGKSVPREEFDDAYMATVVNSKLAGFPLNSEQARRMAWERLILLHEARRRGVSVSDGELARMIRAQFGKDGSFDPTLYENLIRNIAGVRTDTYEEWLRESLMIRRLNELTRMAVWLPDQEVARRFREEETKFKISSVLAGMEEAGKSVEVTVEEIKGYYDSHLKEFKTPPKARVRCLMVPWDLPKEEPAVTDEEAKAYYEEHPGEFTHGKRVRARQILFKAEGKDRAEAEKKAAGEAENVLKRLRGGEEFAKLANKYSQDEKTAPKGGDLGFVEAGEMPKELSDRAFSLKKGEFSEAVKTAQGYTLIAVDEIQEPGTKSLDEAKERLRSRLQREKKERAAEEAKEKAYRRAVDVSLALVDKPDIDVVARARSLKVIEVGPFAAGEPVKEIGPSMDFSKAAFATEVGSFSDIVELPGKGYCIVVPKEKIEEKTTPIEEARDKIIATLKEKKAREAARADAARTRAEVEKRMREKKTDFAASCKEGGIKTEESAPFTSRGPIAGLGAEPAVSAAAAAMSPGEVSAVFDVKKGACFFTVVSREEPSEKETAEGMERFRNRAQREEEGRVLADWNKWLHEQAKKVDYLPTGAAPGETADTGEE